MPSTHRRSCASETLCVVAGCLTWISSRVPGAIGSVQPSCFNRLKPTIAASYRLSAETSTLWRTPDGPVKLTVHAIVATWLTIPVSLYLRHPTRLRRMAAVDWPYFRRNDWTIRHRG